jgi:hypothetical protein
MSETKTKEDAEKKAKRLGLILTKPAANELFIDLDSLEATRDFLFVRMPALKQVWKQADFLMSPSPSGKNGHNHARVTIPELKTLTDHERIALQAALGSDPLREMLAIHNARDGYPYLSVLFEKPSKESEPHGQTST